MEPGRARTVAFGGRSCRGRPAHSGAPPGPETQPQEPHEIDPERGTHAAKVNERLDSAHD